MFLRSTHNAQEERETMHSLFVDGHRQFPPLSFLAICLVSNLLWTSNNALAQPPSRDPISLTHGPMLGQPTTNSMVVWACWQYWMLEPQEARGLLPCPQRQSRATARDVFRRDE